LKHVTRELLTVADPALFKILAYDGKICGFLFAFPDVSTAIQKSKGKLNPISILRLLSAFRKTDGLIINGAGILPQYQKLGGNALLYYELERTVNSRNFTHADLTQIAETTTMMLSDIKTVGGEVYKTHRIYEYKF
ncbi:MAG: hypothetical protein AB1798_03320, partial [Spirochaetota bacterium]